MPVVHGYTCSRARPDPDLLMALRGAGCPVQEIAARIGQSRASTYRWLVRYGIPRRAVSFRRGARRTHGDRVSWLATPDLLALWEERKPDLEYIAQHSGSRPSAIRERLITAGVLPKPRSGSATASSICPNVRADGSRVSELASEPMSPRLRAESNSAGPDRAQRGSATSVASPLMLECGHDVGR